MYMLFHLHRMSTPTPHTLSLHDALPISARMLAGASAWRPAARGRLGGRTEGPRGHRHLPLAPRSEEHTSELQSRRDLVCRLLLEKKKLLATRVQQVVKS